jgi:hypothetical protein
MRLTCVMLACASALLAQDLPLPKESINVNLPANSPVAVIGYVSDQSRTTARGAALVVDLHLGLTLRNAGANRIRGVTLRVVSQEATMGGKGSVTVPSLNIAQGETFPIRIDMQLVRPSQMGGGPLVQVDLDGVLFQDFSFYGPDRLNSRRLLTACELEAQRDREYLKRVLTQAGKEGLRQEILGSIARQQEMQPLSVKVRRGGAGGAVTSAALPAERSADFAFLQFPDSPVEPMQGTAQISGNEARAPRIEVRNRSTKPVKYVELGWLVSDQAGKQYMAGSLPSSEPNLLLNPGQAASVLQDSTISFSSNGQPVNIRKVTGFVNQVEFTDGHVWVPTRQNLDLPSMKAVAPSAEAQRLAGIYLRKGGIDALVEELKKF